MAKDTFFHKGRLYKLTSDLKYMGITLEAMMGYGWTPTLMVEVGHAVPVNDCPHVHAFSRKLNFGGTPDQRIREAWGVDYSEEPALNRESAKGNSGGYSYSIAPFVIPAVLTSNTTRTLIDQLRQRDTKGREKYGTSLDRKDLSLVDWLQHQTEELLDGAGYAQAAKREAERLLRIEKAARLVWIAMQGVNCSSEGVKALNDLYLALKP